MRWQNVRLIFKRELRDQLRDRRTLFSVAVMPMLLYPLMGMAMLQVGQFMRQEPSKVWLVGTDNLPKQPALIVDDQLNPAFLNEQIEGLVEIQQSDSDNSELRDLIEHFRVQSSLQNGVDLVDQLLRREMQQRNADIAVFFPAPIASNQSNSDHNGSSTNAPGVYVFQNSASDKSAIAAERFSVVLHHWESAIVSDILSQHEIPVSLVQGIRVIGADVADKTGKRAALWSKILPFIIVIWALTGAFYPAIDLCAGEKERGTFETLLSSPAARSEIAIGKLLTVMSFSAVTSLCNLLSMGFTGSFVAAKLGGSIGLGQGVPIGFPPVESFVWLLLAMIPISALFSAVALAAAAFARSSKEGQYYLVPLMMISMPLMMVPMLPGAKLNLGTSLIPVSGLMLLLRALIEGQYAECIRYVGPVCALTLACCWLAIRWVVYQFNSETVLFRASERFDLGKWVQGVMRKRDDLPSIGNAVLCGLLILVAKFFIGFAVQTPSSFLDFARQTIVILVAAIGIPAVMMALVLTRSPRKSLRFNGCTLPMASAAILAAIFLNPLFTWITALVMKIYPPGQNMMMLEGVVNNILSDAPGLWAVLLVFAVAPALIEEVAFRGFILSGMEALRNKWQAILLTSLLFGVAHGVIQQSMITFVVGIVMGFIAIQTRSIIPCVLFHCVHNSLAVLISSANQAVVDSSPVLSQILVSEDGVNFQYGILPGILMSVLGLMLLLWFLKLRNPGDDTDLSLERVEIAPQWPVRDSSAFRLALPFA